MRVVIAEDNVLLSTGLELLLGRAGCDIAAVAAVAGDAASFLTAVREHRPDVTIVDIRLPPSFRDEGIRAALQARREHPGLPVLVLSQYVEQQYAAELLSTTGGGVGYLLKDRVSRVDEFVDALRRVAAGGTAMDPEVISKLLASNARNEPVAALSPREREVLELMAGGRSNAAIAAQLFVSEGAVGKHTANIFSKLRLAPSDDTNRRVLAVLAYLNSTGT